MTMEMTWGRETERKFGSNEAITAPLKIVRDLYSKRAGSLSDVLPGDFGVQAYFKEVVEDESVAAEVRALFESRRLNCSRRRSRVFVVFPAYIRLTCRSHHH